MGAKTATLIRGGATERGSAPASSRELTRKQLSGVFRPLRSKAAGEGGSGEASPEGIAEMIVSVFSNVDEGGERILPGFFAESLASNRASDGRPRVKGVWGHDWTMPVAKTLEARELFPNDPLLPDDLKALGGLYIKGQFNMATQRGREAWADLDFGSVDEFSIGFYLLEDQWKGGVHELVKGELVEWSPVLVGMNRETALLGTKAARGAGGGPSGGPELEPRLKADSFADLLAAIATEEALWDARWNIDSALRAALASILEDEELDNQSKLALARASLSQYAEALVNWLGQAIELDGGADLALDLLGGSPAETRATPYLDQARAARAAVSHLVERSRALAALRAKEGRQLSSANREKLGQVRDSLEELRGILDELLAAAEAKPKEEGGKSAPAPAPALASDVARLALRLRLAELGLPS